MVEYAALRDEAQRTEARIFFADAAHFRADAELRGKWVLKGQPALVDSTSPRYGRESQLLFGGVSGDGSGGMAGTGGKQQPRNLGSLFGPVAPAARWAASGNLG